MSSPDPLDILAAFVDEEDSDIKKNANNLKKRKEANERRRETLQALKKVSLVSSIVAGGK